MVMTLCLMVYAAIQHRIRESLKKNHATLDNQWGKPIQNPSARWIFQLFSGIHILYLSTQQTLILNLSASQTHILQLLGEHYLQIYQHQFFPTPSYRHPIWG